MEELTPFETSLGFQDQVARNESDILLLSDKEDLLESCLLHKMEFCDTQEAKNNSYSGLKEFNEEKDSDNLLADQDGSETTGKCSPICPKQDSEELLTHQTEAMEEIIQESPINRMNSEDIQKCFDDLKEDNEKPKVLIEKPLPKKTPQESKNKIAKQQQPKITQFLRLKENCPNISSNLQTPAITIQTPVQATVQTTMQTEVQTTMEITETIVETPVQASMEVEGQTIMEATIQATMETTETIVETPVQATLQAEAPTTASTTVKTTMPKTMQTENPNPKKNQAKKLTHAKEYNDMVNILQHMSKLEWFDGSSLSHKHIDEKHMTPSVVWFIICANYFQRATFAEKDAHEVINDKIEKLRSYVPEIFDRINQTNLELENPESLSQIDADPVFLNELQKAVKAFSDNCLTAEFKEKTMSLTAPNTIPKTAYTFSDDEWLMETRRFIFDSLSNLQHHGLVVNDEDISKLSKIDLQDLITFYEKDLYDATLENQVLIGDLEKRALAALEEEQPIYRLKFDPNCSVADLKFDFPEDEMYIELLERKQNENKDLAKMSLTDPIHVGGKKTCGSSFKPRIPVDDMVCYVCNDGDYTDDDLIVFCSKCNMSVHQKCYGIAVIPKGDWICDVCLNFGETGKYLRCPLCDKRGGAMKPTCTRADTEMFDSLNPTFHAFLKSYATDDFIRNNAKTKYLNLKSIKDVAKNPERAEDDETKEGDEDSDDDFNEQLYYDIQFLDENFTEEELVNEPKPAYIWAHMTCATFVPEMYFGDSFLMTNILGLENVAKDRFKYECEVCGKKKNGSIINCGKGSCKKSFHPECARRANYYLDFKETEASQQVTFHIFCEKHMPLKLRRTLESKDKKMKEEINKYFKTVERYCITAQNNLLQNATLSDPDMLLMENKPRKEKREEGQDFLDLIEKYKEITGQCSIHLQRMQSEENQDLYEITDIIVQKQNFGKDRKLTAEDDIWGILPWEGWTPEQKYKKYREIMNIIKKKNKVKELKKEIHRRNIERAKEIKAKTAEKSKAAEKEKKAQGKKGKEQQVYCICKAIYHGELMICCDLCGDWLHPECAKIPSNVNLEQVSWFCNKCTKKMGWKDVDFVMIDKIGKQEILQKKMINCEDLEEEEPEILKKVKVAHSTYKKTKKITKVIAS